MPAAIPEQETQNISTQRPHLVLLGAGASLAAFPNGERSGKTLPLMQNLVDVLELQPYLDSLDIEYEDRNFEDVYSELHGLPEARYNLQLIEQRVAEYFGSLKLPDEPTLYDYLVLSLREKDVVATFNWDPFLWQAVNRNYRVAKSPHLLFLHGNVAVGFCVRDRMKERVGAKCSKCHQPFIRSELLFPVKQKDYSSDPYISSEWETLRRVLEHAYIFTIFGYSAPESDAEAAELMRVGWGKAEERNLEEIEIIDKKSHDELSRTWANFIHSHHYRTTTSFYKSWIARHPRRTCDAMWSQFMNSQFLDANWIPQNLELCELREWFMPLIDAEV